MTKLERAQAGLDRAIEHVVDAQNKLNAGLHGAGVISLQLGLATAEIIKVKEALVVRPTALGTAHFKRVYKKVDKRPRRRKRAS